MIVDEPLSVMQFFTVCADSVIFSTEIYVIPHQQYKY